MKKKIGISYTMSNFQNYWNWFTEEDLQNEIELVRLSFKENNTEDIYICDGFILTGGVDIDPSLYEGGDYADKPAFQIERDRFETKIFEYSQTQGLPVLGICRGLQLINVLQGGKLIEDIGEANTRHKKENEIDKDHIVRAAPNSLLGEITGLDGGEVNSAHHQAVQPAAIGENLQVNAWSESDSIIEGLEFKDKADKAFMLCVQWHPERMKDKDINPFSQKLKERFLEEIKKVKKK